MWRYISSGELYHHGIQGQRWGRRNGPPYPLDASDHSASEKKEGLKRVAASTARVIRSRDKNLKNTSTVANKASFSSNKSRKSSDDSNEKRKLNPKVKKALIVGGVAAGAVVGVIALRRLGQNYADQVIKEGETIQTLSYDKDRIEKGKSFYTAFKQSDKNAYVGLFGKSGGSSDTKYANIAQASKDLKVASNNSANKVFQNLLKNDSDFAKDVAKSYEITNFDSHDSKGLLEGAKSKVSKGLIGNTYEAFNRVTLVGDNESSERAKSKFYDAMKKVGYSGVTDMNDQQRTWVQFNTSNPTIIFDRSGFVKNEVGGITLESRKLTEYEVTGRKIVELGLRTPLNALGAGAVAGVATNVAMNKRQKDDVRR